MKSNGVNVIWRKILDTIWPGAGDANTNAPLDNMFCTSASIKVISSTEKFNGI